MRIITGLNAPWVGGTRIHVLSLLEGLQKRGHDITFITDRDVMENEMKSKGINFRYRVQDLLPMLELMLDVSQEFSADIIHAHPSSSILESFFLAELIKVPFVVTMHGEYSMCFQKTRLGKAISNSVFAVIAVSENVKRFLIKKTSLIEDKVIVIPNGINTQEFKPKGADPALMGEYGIGKDETVLLYAGRLDHDKEYAIISTVKMVEALVKKGVKVKCIFAGTGSMQSLLQDYAQVLPVNIIGFSSKMNQVLAIAHVVIGAGRSALEAMAMGKPVMAMGRGGFLGVVSGDNWGEGKRTNFGDHGVLPLEEVSNMTGSLLELLEKDLDREGKYLRDLVVRDFSLEMVVKQVEELYFNAFSRL